MFYIGTSGWRYRDWEGIFYPENIKGYNQLKFYSQKFNCVEINSTFYRMPKLQTVYNWLNYIEREDFKFFIKVHRSITHLRKLKDCDPLMEDFISRFTVLKNNLGGFLLQLPPSFKYTDKYLESLAYFIKKLPSEFNFAIEFRHPSMWNKDIYKLLKEFLITLVVIDAPYLPFTPEVETGYFKYFRFHGHSRWYNYCYSKEELEKFKFIITSPPVKTTYIFFNNDYKGYALKNAEEIRKLINET